MRAALLVVLVAGCGFSAPDAGPSGDDVTTDDVADDAIVDDAPGVDAASDAPLSTVDGADAPPQVRQSCAGLHAADPTLPSGTYTIDPDGPGGVDAFLVKCDMVTNAGGWTLVGLELVGAGGHTVDGPLRALDADSQNPDAIANGTQSGIIGVRFAGHYSEVSIRWGSDQFIQFTRPTTYDLFANVLNTAVPITNVSTSDGRLSTWIATDAGAVWCNASHSSDVRPGNSTWAVKPRLDTETGCGCNSTNWMGHGAYYGGAANPTLCGNWGGSWSGVQDNFEAKAGLTATVETRIWIR